MVETEVQTPLAQTTGQMVEGNRVVCVSILRGGNALVEGFLTVLPTARVGHIGLYRDPRTHIPIEYYFKLPGNMTNRHVIVMGAMLATGNSAVAAIDRVKQAKPASVRYVTVLASAEGIKNVEAEHPDVPLYTAAVDPELDASGFILPGLGDAGDRMFGTT